jgi:hypothetical protein
MLMSAPALTLRATLMGCLCRSAPVREFGDHVEDPGVVGIAGGWGGVGKVGRENDE